MTSAPSRRGLIWAIAGAVVLLLAIVAIIISAVTSRPESEPTTAPTSPRTSQPSTKPRGSVVDASVTKKGWVAEPITTDRDTYIRAALAAASTFDPSKSTRDQFLTHLATWFTPDTRRTDPTDRANATQLYLGELSRSVVLPDDQWSQMRSDQSVVTATVDGRIKHIAVPNAPEGMSIGTANVTLTYEQDNATNVEHARVSVQVLCGSGSVPAPNSAQQAGDCKIIRYFDTAVEG